jgi:hypothetical protein
MKTIAIICLGLLILIVGSVSAVTTIKFRQFSTSPGLGRAQIPGTLIPSSTDADHPTYGALQIFVQKVRQYTSYGDGSELVEFVVDNWVVRSGCTIYDTVSGGKPACSTPNGRTVPAQAAFDSGSVVTNAAWGFMFNSVPFGMLFENHMAWLNSKDVLKNGMTPLEYIQQQSLDEDGVRAFPVLGGPRQMSGLFKLDMGMFDLKDLCQAGWVFRYLPPPQDIILKACNDLLDKKQIEYVNISFVSSIPGVSVLGGIQTGGITAFEFAAAIDNYNSTVGGFFTDLSNRSRLDCVSNTPASGRCAQNPGHKGLTSMHYPAWHQPFFSGYLILSECVWSSLTAGQRAGIQQAADEAVYETFYESNTAECRLVKAQLDINDNEVQLNLDGTPKDCDPVMPGRQECSADITLTTWKKDSLNLLRKSTKDYFDDIFNAMQATDQVIFDTLLKSYYQFAGDNDAEWRPESFPSGC